jgi:eukaryotic-like serine/threonine-protein kinase
MSDKPSPKPSADKSAGSRTTGASATASAKFKPSGDPDDSFDFLTEPQGRDELGRLAHYRVLKVLGRGGMGIVFMAEDTRLNRVVALKVMLPSIARKPIARDRFLREARATAAIEHDHIVTIYHVSEEGEPVPYLAMQFLKGMTLDHWLKAGKILNVPQIMRIGKEIAKGLAAAHARQLVHRDIKPSNVWLDAANRGRVKILDFGLARPTDEETHLTQEGIIVGSPAYMSPEQARGQNVDERCDLFSLGCVLYRLCAGRLPFSGSDAMSMLLEIASKEPTPLTQLNADLPVALAELVHRLLAKTPADRPASAKEVVQIIQDLERAWVAGAKTSAMRALRPGSMPAMDATIDYRDVDVEPVLEQSAITDLELQETHISSANRPSPGRPWVFAALIGAVLGVVSILCCLGIAFATNFGYVAVSAEDEIARKLLDGTGLKVRDRNNKAQTLNLLGPMRLPAGEYSIDASELPKSLQFDPKAFTLNRFDTQKITVTYVPPKLTPPKSVGPALVLVTREEARRVQRDWAIFLKRDVIETNSVGMKFTLIPPGEFLMGSTDEQLRQHQKDLKPFEKKNLPDGYANRVDFEKPQHRVRISKPFYFGTTEMTYGQFVKFVAAGKKYLTEPEIKGGGQGIAPGKEPIRKAEYNWKNTGFAQGNEQPLCNITWKDAEAYCQWLSKKENKVYRLPTEAEWEYACRAGSTTLWNYGDKIEVFADRPWCFFPAKELKSLTTHLVGRKKDNEFGLFDMHGNVAEMCSDHWDAAYYELCAKDAITIDPKGPKEMPNGQRVIRGGSIVDPVQAARSAFRNSVDPTLGYVSVGFRIVCEAPLPQE